MFKQFIVLNQYRTNSKVAMISIDIDEIAAVEHNAGIGTNIHLKNGSVWTVKEDYYEVLEFIEEADKKRMYSNAQDVDEVIKQLERKRESKINQIIKDNEKR